MVSQATVSAQATTSAVLTSGLVGTSVGVAQVQGAPVLLLAGQTTTQASSSMNVANQVMLTGTVSTQALLTTTGTNIKQFLNLGSLQSWQHHVAGADHPDGHAHRRSESGPGIERRHDHHRRGGHDHHPGVEHAERRYGNPVARGADAGAGHGHGDSA